MGRGGNTLSADRFAGGATGIGGVRGSVVRVFDGTKFELRVGGAGAGFGSDAPFAFDTFGVEAECVRVLLGGVTVIGLGAISGVD